MEEYPDFHGDAPLEHIPRINKENKCKCGGNCKCKKEAEAEIKTEICGTNCGCNKN